VSILALIIRNARNDDTQSIYLLNLKGLGYDYPKECTKQRVDHILTSNALVLVAEQDEKVVGYIHAIDYDSLYADSLKCIIALVVDEQFRGYGIGRALTMAVESWAIETGASGIRLTSRVSRKDAHKFYEACGYVDRNESKVFIKMF